MNLPTAASPWSVLLALALAAAAPAALARANPVDTLSNPSKLRYDNVNASRPDLDEPFLRDGVVDQPQRFHAIKPGLTMSQVHKLLDQPLKQQQGERGLEWDYNFKFRMSASENYVVCQYKVVFDAQQTVVDAVWRRRQCLDLASPM